ncbi:2-hydroxyacyl-CoA dehydratase family protein [Chloroflexota bacterium]
MNFAEQTIAKCERRLKNIGENPDSTKLACNKLYYQNELEQTKALVAAIEQGSPPITYDPGKGMSTLMRALGFEIIAKEAVGDRIGLDKEYCAKCLELLRSLGYADKACDRTIYPIAMTIMGDLPAPSCIVYSNCTCQQCGFGNLAIAKYFDVPVYHIDIPAAEGEEELAYVTNQLREFIRQVTKDIPGISYDENRLAEWNDAVRRWRNWLHEAYVAMKHRPCPAGARDGFREYFPVYVYPEAVRENGVNHARALAEEYQERVDADRCIDEKVRLVWTASGPQFDMEVFNLLERRGVSLFFLLGSTLEQYIVRPGGKREIGSDLEYGRKLTPLEEVARSMRAGTWGGPNSAWVDDIVWFAKDIGADGVVNFLLRGCPVTVGYHKVVNDRVESELGIPVFGFEAPGLDSSSYDADEAHSRLNDFLDLCLARRAERIGKSNLT